jgi:uncharacterized protein YndB with AHSA1/START domain
VLKINHELSVHCSPERAFEVFTSGLPDWWPAEYTWSGKDALAEIGMESGAGGFCYECGPNGFRCDWGRVLTWDPPRRVVFTWQIGPNREPVPDPAKASEIEVRFREFLVEFEHRGFERYGQPGQAYRDTLASPEGWPYILGCYAEALES